VGGGTLLGSVVSWTLDILHENGDVEQVQYAVTADGGLINKEYSATCDGCIPAVGTVAVWTNAEILYFPVIFKK
jgi:hypothetical protein